MKEKDEGEEEEAEAIERSKGMDEGEGRMLLCFFA